MTGAASPTTALAEADPVLAELIRQVGLMSMERRRRGRPKGDAYATLLRTIIGQQVSVKAAATIFDRVLALFDGELPGPQELIDVGEDALRGAGLSGRKATYLRDLAEHIVSGELEVDRLPELPDETVIEELTAVRGIGVWSAHMFLMFHLERPDVLPVGDLGIRNAVKAAYGLDGPPEPGELERIAEPWRPHRTLACLYLWESLRNTPA